MLAQGWRMPPNGHMPRYSDPTRCPDCRANLPMYPVRCPACALPLRGPLAVELLTTLQAADQLLARLRAAEAPAGPPSGAGPVPQVAAPPVRHTPTGLRAASVPTILLSLGALCLLVAAVTFLAVAWSWLGVGGRTAVLVALTGAGGALGSWLGARGLRVSAESLTVVALGLLALDVVGADNAGWLGTTSPSGLASVVGGALVAASLALMFTPARLDSPQVVAAIGLWVLTAGLTGLTTHTNLVEAAAVLAFAVAAWLGRSRSLRALPWAAFVGGLTWWATLAVSGLVEALDHATVRGLWLDGHGAALLTASALLLLPAPFAAKRIRVLNACGAGGASLATVALAIPGTDDGANEFTIVLLGFVLAWSAVAALTPKRWALVPSLPLGLVALPVLGVSWRLVLDGTARVLEVGDPFTRGAGVRLDAAAGFAHPGLLAPSVAGLVVAAAVLVRRPSTVPWPAMAALALGLAGVGTLALNPVPLWTIVGSLSVLALTLTGDALRRPDRRGAGQAAAGGILGIAAIVSGLPSDSLTTGTTAALVLAAAAVTAVGRFPHAARVGGGVLPLAIAGLVWSAAEVAGIDAAYRAAPVLLVVGLLAVLRARVEIESSAVVATLATAVPAIAAAGDRAGSLALHLTLAGVMVSATTLVNAARRPLGWLAGLLFAAATWVRLADLGVDTPEAYTLPSALALVLVGLWRLQHDPDASTATALTPGLTLATTPSLLWVFVLDPVSLRAALLGLGCLVLVLSGARLRWNAPLVVGSAVGALLVLRELAPYAAQTPQWVLIGLAGTLLTVLGVTWERRVRDVKSAAGYLGRLR